jgi:predicted O-linked N-acetylglucosamine transferase (SPINDLY family)
LGLPVEAQACYERAIAVQSAYADPWINLGNLWRDSGQPERAAGCYRKAAELNPQNAFVWNNLGCAVGDQGSIAESIQCYQRAVTLMPSNHPAFSNILLNLHYVDGPSPEEIAAAHRQFGERFDGLGAHLRAPHTNPPDAERKLRIGYVSADFRRHSVAFFLEPVIERHDPDAVEVYCYSDVGRPDAMTERFTRLAGDRWRDIRGYSLERFAAQVRADGIDILIDTGGHTANSRLASFTTRAAPVQINWLGYPDTTGLPSIGYRFTDAVADPPGQTEAWHSEELIRLPGGFLSFRPPAGSPAPSAVPCLGGGPFTFGSFNNLSKISQATVALWGEILRRTPGSRLALKNRSLNESQARTNLLTSFAAHGIAAERIWLSGLIDSLKGHLEAYGLIDLALDTFPYHGTTTTCEALWMGVPVVTLAGRTHASRVGVSLLGAVGLSELVAASEQDYIDRACSVATDVGRLKAWRASLRETMTASALMDEAGFTRKLEAAYRDLWRRWCKKQERT